MWWGKVSKVLTMPDRWIGCHYQSWHHWDSVDSKLTLYLADSLYTGLFGKKLHLNPSGIVINDGKVGPAIQPKEVHPKVCLWTIWEGRRGSFCSWWCMAHVKDFSVFDHHFYMSRVAARLKTLQDHGTQQCWELHEDKMKMKMYLWWSLCTLYLHACQVRVTVGDSGLCCCTSVCVTYLKY